MDCSSVTERKIIHDSVHGSIDVEGIFLDLIETTEFQRLHNIKQLGLAYLVFPGAHHTRLEHSLGAYQIADWMCQSLGLEREETDEILCAALLHDIAHGPFSHTLEWFLKDLFGFTHDTLAEKILTGEETLLLEGEKEMISDLPTVPEVIERHGMRPMEIASLIRRDGQPLDRSQMSLGEESREHFNIRRYPHQIIQGPIDCDQIDFLMRDSHHTGVAHGVIDLDRLLSTLAVHNDDLVVEYGGVPAVEGMLVARALMYTSVYFHRTVRIAELMLAKAAERLDRAEVDVARKQNDFSFLSTIQQHDDFSRKMVTSLKYRNLYKAALVWDLSEVERRERNLITELRDYKQKMTIEESICKRAGVPSGSVIIDVPSEEIATTEPRMSSVKIGILDEGRVRFISRISPLANSLQLRKVQGWALMVACPKKMGEDVRRAAERVLA